MQENDIRVGMLFRFNKRLSIHGDVDGHIGVVLNTPCSPMKVQVSHKTLWIPLLVYGEVMKVDLVKARHWYNIQIGIVL